MRKIIICFLLMLFFSSPLLATPRSYTVHLVIFSHLTPQTVSAEQWPLLPSIRITSATNAKPSFALAHEANALSQQPGYQVLFNGKWRETWSRGNETITIPFSNGTDAQGNLSITLGHYFDVHAEVLMTAPLGMLRNLDTSRYFDHVDQSPFVFSLSQDRRMKSQALNYLATPVIGVLIEMTK